jgi:hypothetical protein
MVYVQGNRHRLIAAGWENHTLRVDFADGRSEVFGGVPERVKDHLVRSCEPESYFRRHVKGKYVGKRYDLPPSGKPLPKIDYKEVPF